jgi:integrase
VLYARTRTEAHQKLRQALGQRDHGALVVAPRQTVRQLLEAWLRDVVKPNRAPRTYLAYEEKLRLHALPYLGGVSIERLTPAHLTRLYRERLEAGLAPASVAMVHNILHRALEMATRQSLVARNVADLVEVPRASRRGIQPLDGDQLQKLLGAIDGQPFGPLWTLLLATGLRFGEAAALRWEDISSDGATLNVQHTLTRMTGSAATEHGWRWKLTPPKTARSRRPVPLNATAQAALRQQRRRQLEAKLVAGPDWEEFGLVFASRHGLPVREAHALRDLQNVLKKAGLPRRRLHDLRHQFATLLYQAGESPRSAQELLGHARVSTTLDIYTGSVPQVLRDAVDGVDALLGRPPAEGSADAV